MRKFLLGFLILGIFTSCVYDDYTPVVGLDAELTEVLNTVSNGQGLSYFVLPDSDDFSSIPQDPLNPITEEKVALGKLLLHETALGSEPKTSGMEYQYVCASCHPVAGGFKPGRRQGIGEGGMGFGNGGEGRIINPNVPLDSVDIQAVRPPALLNLAYQDVMLWNGQFGGTGTNAGTEASWGEIPINFLGFQGIEVQAIESQGTHRLVIDENFVDTFGYRAMFDAAFPDVDEHERYTAETGGLAIAAFNRTLLANKAPWQDYLKGDVNALSDTEKKGALVFFGNGRCFECHTGPALKDKGFYAFGMGDFDVSGETVVLDAINFDEVKKGRGAFTNKSEDDYKFKTPTLYNLVDGNFFGHGGTFTSIRDVIVYKNNGVPQNSDVPTNNLASQFGRFNLTEQEIDDLTAFIENSLRDPDLIRYVPDAVNSGYCFPNNDPQSQIDLDCN
ncbi:cytochrome-c peroxidase [Flavobacteriaceae bacterium AU392]|nr:cytochrome-c peroxidase [Flavobacteriaceae bacterium]RKM85012.1 cytochrome-c peroxidase [Flavobacteriaceae bacterium AU392]